MGYIVNDTVVVTVRDTTAPLYLTGPSSMVYEEGTQTYIVNWTFFDLLPYFYTLSTNGTQYYGDTWNGSTISINLGGMSIGVYNLTLVVNDTSSNQANFTGYLIVTEPSTTTGTPTTTDTTITTGTTTTTPAPDENNNTLIIIAAIAGVVVVVVVILFTRRK